MQLWKHELEINFCLLIPSSIMDFQHPEIKDSAEQIGGGGVSIFYCHTLQLLFFSYVQGKSFMAPLKSVAEELKNVFRIEVSSV